MNKQQILAADQRSTSWVAAEAPQEFAETRQDFAGARPEFAEARQEFAGCGNLWFSNFFARFVTCPRSHRDRAKSSQRRAKSSRRYTKSPQGRSKGSQKRVKSSQDAQTYGFRMLHLLIC